MRNGQAGEVGMSVTRATSPYYSPAAPPTSLHPLTRIFLLVNHEVYLFLIPSNSARFYFVLLCQDEGDPSYSTVAPIFTLSTGNRSTIYLQPSKQKSRAENRAQSGNHVARFPVATSDIHGGPKISSNYGSYLEDRNMAPTICLAEIPMPKIASNPYAHRRQKIHNSGVIKQQKLEIVQMLNVAADDLSLSPSESSLWKAGCPTNSCVPAIGSSSNTAAKVPVDLHEHWRNILIRREGLLNIVSRTMALVRRNHILQKRINALRMETRDFIRSVLGNPKNKSIQEDDSTTRIKKEVDLDCEKEVTQMKDSIVSSSSEDTCETSCFSPSSPDSTSSLENCVTSGSCVSMDVGSDSLDDSDATDDSVL